MMYSLKKLWKNALGTDIAGRTLAVRADDTFIISYPRSGNTWTRFLIANLMHPHEPVTFANIERLIPDAEAQSSRYMRRTPSPRMIKSHSYFDPRYPRVIYIVPFSDKKRWIKCKKKVSKLFATEDAEFEADSHFKALIFLPSVDRVHPR